MTVRSAKNPDYQLLAAEFSVGDVVVPFGGAPNVVGRVVAVWPGIGMVDVECPTGTVRYPVEELLRLDENGVPSPPFTQEPRTVSVPGGPIASASRVAAAYYKQSLYWAATNRQYKATREERDTGNFTCPRCAGQGRTAALKLTSYKRRDAKNVKLYVCPECTWAIKPGDLIGCETNGVL